MADVRSTCHLPSRHWKCSLSAADSRGTANNWNKVDVETLAEAWEKLCYLPEFPKEVESIYKELSRYYRIEEPRRYLSNWSN